MSDDIFFCFDSNTLEISSKDLESFDEFYLKKIDELKNYLENEGYDKKIRLLFPETVLSELETHKKKKLTNWIKQIDNYSTNISNFSEIKKITSLLNVNEHVDKLKENLLKDIELIQLPNDLKSLFENVYERSLHKTPPFKQGNSDPGFKDCIIFLSLKEYARNYDGTSFYFFTKDKGFTQPEPKNYLENEFKKDTNNCLIIKDTNDFIGLTKELFKLDLEISNFVANKLIPQIEDEFSNFKKIKIDSVEFTIQEIELNSEEITQEDLGDKINIEFVLNVKFNDDGEVKEINDLKKKISIDKETKKTNLVSNYNYEVSE